MFPCSFGWLGGWLSVVEYSTNEVACDFHRFTFVLCLSTCNTRTYILWKQDFQLVAYIFWASEEVVSGTCICWMFVQHYVFNSRTFNGEYFETCEHVMEDLTLIIFWKSKHNFKTKKISLIAGRTQNNSFLYNFFILLLLLFTR